MTSPCTPGVAFLLLNLLTTVLEYGAFEVLVTGEKSVEYKEYSEYWCKKLHDKQARLKTYDHLRMFAGRAFDPRHSAAVWKIKYIVEIDLTANFNAADYEKLSCAYSTSEDGVRTRTVTIGPYRNGFAKTFINIDKIFAIFVGTVVARHYAATDTRTYEKREGTKMGYRLRQCKLKASLPLPKCFGCS